MTAKTRVINQIKYNTTEIVTAAIAKIDSDSKPLDIEKHRSTLTLMGYRNMSDEFLTRYARETAILNELTRTTGANFAGQIGKIDFTTTDTAIAGVDSYLNRRIQGQHARWTSRH